MTFIDFALLSFLGVSSLRILAYYTQILAIAKDVNGATAVSLTTWTLFAASHLSTAIYALASSQDWMIAIVFLLNGTCSVIIVALTVFKRRKSTGGALGQQAPQPRQAT